MAGRRSTVTGVEGKRPAGSRLQRPRSLSDMEAYEGTMVGMDVSSGPGRPRGLPSALSQGQLPTAMLEMQSEFMDQLGLQQHPVPSGRPQEQPAKPKPMGSIWKKVALAFLGLCAVLAVIALALHLEGSRLQGQLPPNSSLQQQDPLGTGPGDSNCSEYREMFTHWLNAFCKLADCSSQLCHRLWSYFDGSCYYFSSVERDWQTGRQDCISHGADLLVIRSKREQKFVARVDSRNAYWLGMWEVPQNLSWVWVDGTLLQDGLTFWQRGYPVGYFDYQLEEFGHCGLLSGRAWINVVCGERHRWICKRSSEKLPFSL